MSKHVVLPDGTVLGQGMPKICVPITGETLPEILAQAKKALAAKADLLEWRVDFFSQYANATQLTAALQQLHSFAKGTPILFTFRSKPEGGNGLLSSKSYHSLISQTIRTKLAALIDIELSAGEDTVKSLATLAKENNTPSVVSAHNFSNTPPQPKMLQTLKLMQSLGASIPKIAVTPSTPADVLALLCVSEEYSRLQNTPLVAISMGSLGAISRISGQLFGSCFTFCTAGAASAPGQLSVQQVRSILNILNLP